MSLYHKYRPESLDSIMGNSHITGVLDNMLNTKDCPHAFLLWGDSGCGKTTIGRIIATRLECTNTDFREINAADFKGIDTIREIVRNSQFLPLESPCRVWLIDECHELTNPAQNALLKILEDSPPHVYFVLATTDPQKLLPTIKGRCQEFQVKPLDDNLMKRLLRRVVRSEGENLEMEVYDQIIQDSQGHPRNALQILEQVLSVSEDQRLEVATKTAALQSQTIELCRTLLKKSSWKEISTILSGLKDQEPESIRRTVLGYCSAVLLKSDNERAGLVLECFNEPLYNVGFPGLVLNCYQIYKG